MHIYITQKVSRNQKKNWSARTNIYIY